MSMGGPAQILSGKYRLERELGRGGMGSVWLAHHLTLNSAVAIKLIDPAVAQNPEAVARFLREARAAASLRSPHVVQILDHGVDEGVPFIVMELLEGESLGSRLARVGSLSPADTARIFTQVARAVSKAHEAGIVHRDLKPDNIFLVKNDEEELAKVLDFGIAKAQDHGLGSVSSATRTGAVLGTPYYMSPEQAEGAKTLDQRSDIWSLGVIAWECLLGVRPFDSETLGGLLLAVCARELPVPSRVGSVPLGFDAWFARACARDLAQRFASAKDAAQELSRLCNAVPAAYPPPSSRELAPTFAVSQPRLITTTGQMGMSSPPPAAKRSRAPWLALGLVGLVAVALGGGFAYRANLGSAASAASAIASVAPSPSSVPAQPATTSTEVSPPAAALPAAAPSASVSSLLAPTEPRATAPLAAHHTAAHRAERARASVAALAAPPAPAPAPIAPAPRAPSPTASPQPGNVDLGL
jgi:serine/threonine protein kinase